MAEQLPCFLLGSEHSDYLRVEIAQRLHPGATDYWDGNWVDARITIRAGGFRAAIDASLRTTDFSEFRHQVEGLQYQLDSKAAFATMEGWLSIELAGDGRGHIDIRGTVVDEPGMGNKLRFSIPGVDQTYLPDLVRSLRSIEAAYPTIPE